MCGGLYIKINIYIYILPSPSQTKKHLPSQAKPLAHSLGTPPSVQRNGW